MSSLKDLASLIMVPSLYKDGELHTVKPLADEDVILHPDATGNHDGNDGTTPRSSSNFTFSRGSNLAATRVDVNGLIEKGRENLLLRSNEFDNAYWSKSDSSILTGQADPNGGSNAFKVVENTNTAYHRIFGGYTMVSGNVYTTSVTAKAAGRNYLTLSNNVSAGTCIFNLTDGSVSLQESSVISASTTSLGGGWYRCEMVAAGDKSGTYNVFIGCDDDGVIAPYTGDGTSGVFIYQSQLELGLVATDYIETGASTAQAGILEDMPRLDYSGSCPSLLLEPQRTNLINDSEYFEGSDWIGTNVTSITPNYGISPEGKRNSTRIVGTNQSILYYPLNTPFDGTRSIYVKATSGSGSIQLLSHNSNTDNIFEIDTNWQRVDVTDVQSGTGINNLYALDMRGAATDIYDIEIWGCQYELGSYPTSYIPTYGSSVTRSADDMDTTFSSPLATNGNATYFIELNGTELGGGNSNARNFSLDFTSGDYITYNRGASSVHRLKVEASGTAYYSTSGITSFAADEPVKMAAVVTATSVVMYVNGQEAINESLVGNWDSAYLFRTNISDLLGIVPVKQFVFFPTALTDSECIALTTL